MTSQSPPPRTRSTQSSADVQDEGIFPPQTQPRVWFLTRADCPVGTEVTRKLLEHGDWVVAGVGRFEEGGREEWEAVKASAEREGEPGEAETGKLRTFAYDICSLSECQAAIAETIDAFGRLDVLLCCHSEALVGTIEELGATPTTRSLVTTQLSTNFFGSVNIIKSALPTFRAQRSGHVVLLTGITGHLGTPGLAALCASQWAIEGYCDSLAYEVAPFGVRMSIVQSNIEIGLLTNKVTAVPEMAAYAPPANEAPLARGWLGNLADRLAAASPQEASANGSSPKLPSALLHDQNETTSFHPHLPAEFRTSLISETVHALLAIGGHENPPARHIVGFEGVASVKEKLRTVSEELEDFLECSAAVDFE